MYSTHFIKPPTNAPATPRGVASNSAASPGPWPTTAVWSMPVSNSQARATASPAAFDIQQDDLEWVDDALRASASASASAATPAPAAKQRIATGSLARSTPAEARSAVARHGLRDGRFTLSAAEHIPHGTARDHTRKAHATNTEQIQFEQWFDQQIQQIQQISQMPPVGVAPLGRARPFDPAHPEVIDLTDDTDMAHGHSNAARPVAAEATAHAPQSATKRKADGHANGAGPAVTRPRTAALALARPARAYYPNNRADPQARQRLQTFHDQVACIDYDRLITVRDPNRADSVRALFNHLRMPLDPTLSARAFFATIHHRIFAPVLMATTGRPSLTNEGVVAHVNGLPEDERANLRSCMDVALSIAKAGKSTSFATIVKAMTRQAGAALPIYRLDQPYNRSTLATILATPGTSIEPPAERT